jgi:hypothetical protein
MADHAFHLAQGAQDFDTFAQLWPDKWGSFEDTASVQLTIVRAMQGGSAFLVRRTEGAPVGAVVIDLETYENTLFVPVLVPGGDSAEERAEVKQKLTAFIVKAALTVGADRMLFMRDADPKHEQAVKEFAGLAKQRKFPGQIHVLGTVRNLFGDGRNISVNSLFIPASQRPNLLKTMMGETHDVMRAAATLTGAQGDDKAMMTAMARISGGGGLGGAGGPLHESDGICSGCKEKDDKEFKDGKDREKSDRTMSLQVDPNRAGATGILQALPNLNVVTPPGVVPVGGSGPSILEQPVV